jgi:hypothetical protein
MFTARGYVQIAAIGALALLTTSVRAQGVSDAGMPIDPYADPYGSDTRIDYGFGPSSPYSPVGLPVSTGLPIVAGSNYRASVAVTPDGLAATSYLPGLSNAYGLGYGVPYALDGAYYVSGGSNNPYMPWTDVVASPYASVLLTPNGLEPENEFSPYTNPYPQGLASANGMGNGPYGANAAPPPYNGYQGNNLVPGNPGQAQTNQLTSVIGPASSVIDPILTSHNRIFLRWIGPSGNVTQATYKLLDAQGRVIQQTTTTGRPGDVVFPPTRTAAYYGVLVLFADGTRQWLISPLAIGP